MKWTLLLVSGFFLFTNAAAHASPSLAKKIEFLPTDGKVQFHASGHPSALHVVGTGSGPAGELSVNQENASGVLTFDLTTLHTGISIRDHHMKERYLQVQKYPKATLKITGLKLPRPLNASFGSVHSLPFQGLLTLHGVQKPVSGTIDINSKSASAGQLHSDAKFNVKLTDFGIPIPSFLGITIDNKVQLDVKADVKVL